jgi:predicted ATPase/DNA-binding SARP family transcriptional activator/Tfp pilus assembly protein PilF
MNHLRLFLLGAPRIECNGELITVDTRKATALAAYLAVTGESRSRDQLATLLWPELDQTRARAALRRTLSTLKRALDGAWLEIERERIGLRRDTGFWLDVEQFQDYLAQCRSHGHQAEDVCPACLDLLTKAVSLYRGDFLEGFTLRDSAEFDEWQFFQSDSLRREMAAALAKIVRIHSTQGDLESAIAYARQWLSLDVLHEPAHCCLMALYARSGQRAAALRQYQQCVEVLEQEVGVSPQEETTQLYQAIRENRSLERPDYLPQSPLTNLPAQPTRFVGRSEELARIRQLLADPACRLLTLVGPGGIGKTRLALQAAQDNACIFSDGVHFVPLAALSSADLLVPTIIDSLNIPPRSDMDPKEHLCNHLREKEILLLLDNVEHLLDKVGFLAEILAGTRGVKILATSRERMNLRWEWPFEVVGLDFPRNGDSKALEDYSAVQLFLQEVHRVCSGTWLSKQESPCVVRICQLLEGIPLGIELAAAWTQTLSCHEIVQGIERSLTFLRTPLRDVPERHRSLQAAFDHSWELLSGEEQSIFSRLSVFRGGFRAGAAKAVADASPAVLATLLDKSLLRRVAADRYEILEVLRQYAAEKLHNAPQERDGVHDRHCQYYVAFMRRQGERLPGKEQQEALAEIGAEIENVRAAWRWAVERQDVRTITEVLDGLYRFYETQSWFQEGEQAFGTAVEKLREMNARGEAGILVAKILARRGWFCQRLSRFEEARTLSQESLSILQHPDVREELVLPLSSLGTVAFQLGDYSEAKQLFQEAFAISKEAGDRLKIAKSLNNLVIAVWTLGEYMEARRLIEESLAIYQEIGDQKGVASCLTNLGNMALLSKNYAEAKELFEESLQISEALGNRRKIALLLTNLGMAAEGVGDYEEAQRLHQKSITICREIDDLVGLAEGLNYLGFTLCKLGEHQEARPHFRAALTTSVDIQATPITLKALIGLALLLEKKEEWEKAVELLAHVLCHPAADEEIEDRAKPIFARLKLKLAPATLAAAQERGKAETLDHLVSVYRGDARG